MSAAILQVEQLNKAFGGVQAIRDLSFDLNAGEVLGLIGPNGSGKSTIVNVLAGVFPATSGRIVLAGNRIERLTEYERVAKGLARTFQTARLFPEFTIRQQVILGCNSTLASHPLSSVFGMGTVAGEEGAIARRVQGLLELCHLAEIADRPVSTASSAEQRFLMIATALASEPSVILLDEPAAGMVVQERKLLSELIREIRNGGTSVLVIEHHMALIMEVCDRILVLNFGAKIAEGTPEQIRNDQAVIDAYLGEAA